VSNFISRSMIEVPKISDLLAYVFVAGDQTIPGPKTFSTLSSCER
jgi:hypothetical protein